MGYTRKNEKEKLVSNIILFKLEEFMNELTALGQQNLGQSFLYNTYSPQDTEQDPLSGPREKPLGFIIGERIVGPLVDRIITISKLFFNSIDSFLTFPKVAAQDGIQGGINDQGNIEFRFQQSDDHSKKEGSYDSNGNIKGRYTHISGRDEIYVEGNYNENTKKGNIQAGVKKEF